VVAAPSSAAIEATPVGRFEEEAAHVMARIRREFGRLIEALPGSPRRAGDVQRILGVDKALGWQIFRVGTEAQPLEAAPLIPRPAPMAKALRAASERGVPPAVIAAARDAADAFERLVERHAGDRGSFDAMARGLQDGSAEQIHLKERRAAFRANSSIWGLSALASYSCITYHDGERAGTQDSTLVIGHAGLRKLRPGVNASIGYQWSVRKSTDTSGGVGVRVTPNRGAEFLEQFSTRPLPPLVTREIEPGAMETAFQLEGVGRSGAITYFVRHIARAASDDKSAGWWGGNMLCRVPTEVGVYDVMIPCGWCDPSTATVTVYGNLQDVSRVVQRNEADRLPVAGVISHLGNDLDRLQTPVVPRCPEMIAAVLRGMGWERTRFDLYRCVVQYPILHAGVATRIEGASR
jgi:hypothetical protein